MVGRVRLLAGLSMTFDGDGSTPGAKDGIEAVMRAAAGATIEDKTD
jgi:hypothetical protein